MRKYLEYSADYAEGGFGGRMGLVPNISQSYLPLKCVKLLTSEIASPMSITPCKKMETFPILSRKMTLLSRALDIPSPKSEMTCFS